jgi:hypothetical protein
MGTSMPLADFALVDRAVEQFEQLVRLDNQAGHSDFAENWAPGSKLTDYELVIKFWI